MNIVVAEDELLALDDVLTMLRSFAVEHQIAGFRSGNAVLAHAQTSAVDLLITDIRMPGMDGLELIRRLQEQTDDFATIVLSSYGEFEYARAGIRLGIVDYLLKPVRTEVLHKTVDTALAGLLAARAGREQARDAQLAQMLNGRPTTDGALHRDPWGIIVTVCENWEGPGTWQAAGLDRDFYRRALGGDQPESYDIVDLDAHCRVVLTPPEEARLAQVKGKTLRIHHASQAAGAGLFQVAAIAAGRQLKLRPTPAKPTCVG